MAEMFGIHERAIRVHAARTEQLAENIANANTPGYKAKDIDFRAVLAGSSNRLALAGTSSGHMSIGGADGSVYVQPLAPSLDGNTVDVEAEKVKLMEASQRYTASLEFLSGTIKARMKVLKGE